MSFRQRALASWGTLATAGLIPPIYGTLLTASLTTVTAPGSFLFVVFTAAPRHIGPFIGIVAINFRFRLNGTLVAPGGGTTINMVRNRIGSVAYTLRLPITPGVQLVAVEWAGFGLGANTLVIDPVTLPDLVHAQLTIQEQRT